MATRSMNVYVVLQVLQLPKYGIHAPVVLGAYSRIDKAQHMVEGQPKTERHEGAECDAVYYITKHRVQ